MAEKICIVGASGKLGMATLSALIDQKLWSAENIHCTSSSTTGASRLAEYGVRVFAATWDDPIEPWIRAFTSCQKVFLISSARIDKDYDEAAPGHGREADHATVLRAVEQAGVEHVYYTSLAFANPSASRVMTAHERTEAMLHASPYNYTIIREGLYSESWPLYLGHFDVTNDDRGEVVIAGDSKINWTSIADLGLASALILASPSREWAGKTCYLAQSAASNLAEVAAMVTKARGKKVVPKIVSREEHERHYIQDRGLEKPFIEWWSKTYDALRDNECDIRDPTLEDLLSTKGIQPKPMSETVKEMIGFERGFARK